MKSLLITTATVGTVQALDAIPPFNDLVTYGKLALQAIILIGTVAHYVLDFIHKLQNKSLNDKASELEEFNRKMNSPSNS